MKYILTLFFLLPFLTLGQEKPKTIHVFVALCDNENQGIVPVSRTLGNGQNPTSNLYWGALYGIKTHFKNSKNWSLVNNLESENPQILERILFKHNDTNTFLLADAYDGKYIKQTTIDFFESASGAKVQTINFDGNELSFGGNSNLVAYIGHDGLMEFDLDQKFDSCSTKERDAIMLACISKDYFSPYLEQTGANPLVWTTGLMAPEAYTLKWALDGWMIDETDAQVRERAAQAYHYYQKCGIRGARNLLVTGF